MKKYIIICAIGFTIGLLGCDNNSNPTSLTVDNPIVITHPTTIEEMPIITRMNVPVDVILESCLELTPDQRKTCTIERAEFIEMRIAEAGLAKSLFDIQKSKENRIELLDPKDPDFALKFRSIELEYEGKKHYEEERTIMWLKSLSKNVSHSFLEVMNEKQKRLWNEWIVLNKKPC